MENSGERTNIPENTRHEILDEYGTRDFLAKKGIKNLPFKDFKPNTPILYILGGNARKSARPTIQSSVHDAPTILEWITQ